MSCSWAPTIEQVAAILRSRTRGPESRDASIAGEQGTFTDQTRPTAEQVTELIDVACGELSGMLGGRNPCTDELRTGAAAAATYRVAQLIEVSYFPEQVNSDQTAFAGLQKMWVAAAKAIVASVSAQCPIVPSSGSQGVAPLALYSGTDAPYAADAAI